MNMELALDCRHYLGDRPCRFARRCRCDHYSPMGRRVAIIKLGALGDVVRTACLLPTLKRLMPLSHVTWITRPSGVRILTGHPQIDRLAALEAETALALSAQTFDLVLSLDKEPAPAALCNTLRCHDKRGMRLSPHGTVEPANAACRPYFELGLDDELKFRANHKSYPQLIHEALDLPYLREPYRLAVEEPLLVEARERAAPWRAAVGGPLVGLNTGSGTVFANKAPSPRRWVRIARALLASGVGVVLLGGPDERASNAWIAERAGPPVVDAGAEHTERQFVALVSQLDAVVAGDTLALHVAVARRVPVVGLFGPTCAQEIDLFARGIKLVSSAPCGPCYRRSCDRRPNCMDAINVADIVAAVRRLCRAPADVRVAL